MITRQQAEQYSTFMGLRLDDITYATLTARYRELVKQYHPDLGGLVDEWRALRKSYDTLGEWLRQIKHVEGECKECSGTGRTKTRPVRWCRACQGRGRALG